MYFAAADNAIRYKWGCVIAMFLLFDESKIGLRFLIVFFRVKDEFF